MPSDRRGHLVIRTPEGVEFSLLLAGPMARFLAWVIDEGVIIALEILIAAVVSLAPFFPRDWLGLFFAMSFFVLQVGYGMAFEWFWQGQTLGKRVMNIRVMDVQGFRLQPGQVIMRNLLRAIDQLPFLYLVGGLALFLSRYSQRLGDLAAATVVIQQERVKAPDVEQLFQGKFNSLMQYPHLAARLRQKVAPAAAIIALQSLMRRDQMEPIARVSLFEDLAAHFRTLVEFPAEATDSLGDEQYVRDVAEILFRRREKA